MSKQQDLNLFEKYLFEAPGDEEAPDANMSASDNTPPDLPDNNPEEDGTFDDTGSNELEPPPDIGGDDFNTNDDSGEDEDQDGEEDKTPSPQGLDAKVSAIMNQNLYKRFLTLMTQITTQQASIKNNSDVLYTLSADTALTVRSLNKLEENIRLYLKNTYTSMNYTRNLLFFNKCLNLLNLINENFDKAIRKGIKEQ